MKRKVVLMYGAFLAAGLLSLSSCHDCDNDPTAKKTTLSGGESCPTYCSKNGYKKSQTLGMGFSQECCCF